MGVPDRRTSIKKATILMVALAVGMTTGLAGCKKKKKDGDKKETPAAIMGAAKDAPAAMGAVKDAPPATAPVKVAVAATAYNCESISARIKKCAGEVVTEMTKGMKTKLPAGAVEKMKKEFTSDKMLAECKKEMVKNSEKNKKEMAKMKPCFEKATCGEFAVCFNKAMK